MSKRFRELVGIEYPLVAFSHCRDVVAAVTNSGGMGILGAAKFTPEELETELAWIDEHVGGKPYGVDVLAPPADEEKDIDDLVELRSRIPTSHHHFVDLLADRLAVPEARDGPVPREFSGIIVNRRTLQQQIDISLSHPIKFLVSGLGPFSSAVVARARSQGVAVGGLCGNVKHALRQVAGGADVVVAQGTEAAGHTGDISTLVLVPQVVDAVAPVPVLAAGGIVNGRQLAAILALGAQGAWTGSVWLTTEESDVDPAVIGKLLEARSEQTIRTRAYTGKPVRMLRTPFEDAWEDEKSPRPLPAPYQGLLVQPLLQRIYQHRRTDLMGQAVGQGVGLMRTRRSSRAVVEEMMAEMVDALDSLLRELSG